MNDPYGLLASGMTPEQAAEALGLQRREAMAQALMAQGMMPLQAPQNRGRLESAISPLEVIAKVVSSYGGGAAKRSVENEKAHFADRRQKAVADAMMKYEQVRSGSPGVIPLTPNDDEGNAMPSTPAVPGDPRKAIAQAIADPLLAGNPMVAADIKAQNPVVVGRSLMKPTGEVVASDPVVAQEREAKREEAQLQREQRMTELQARLEDRNASREDRQAHQRELAKLYAELRGTKQEPLVAIVGPDGRPTYVPRSEAIGKTPAGNRPEKNLPVPLQKQLTETSELADATDRFVSTWKDDYGGKTVMGGASNTMGRIFGDSTGQTQWWQDYELHQSQIRNKLFGSALTASELAAWDKSAINPRMDPKQIKANLDRQQALEKKALGKLMRGAIASGYNPDQIEAFTGRSAPSDTPKSGNVRVVDW